MKKLTHYFFLFFIFLNLNTICHSKEIYDVEILPSLRSQQYPLNLNKKIIIFSAPRTGSSLTYNIFRFLFEDDSMIFSRHDDFNLDRFVLKTHRFEELKLINEENVTYIFTLRNPIHTCLSHYRVVKEKKMSNKTFAKDLVNRHYRYLTFFEEMKNKGKKIAWLKYEDFSDNIEHTFDFIENHFQISITIEDKELMRKGFSRENIYACIENFSDFSEYLPLSGFHGKHLNINGYTPPEDFIYWLNHFLEEIKPLLKKYGYFSE